MSTVEITITGADLRVGDVIVNQFGARTVTEIVERSHYATRYTTEYCRQCSCSNLGTITVRRAS